MELTKGMYQRSFANQRSSARIKHYLLVGLLLLVLILLPYERLMLPYSLRLADFALVLIIMYGVFRILITGQRVYLPLIGPIWLILVASMVAYLTGLGHSNSLIAMIQELYLYLWFVVLTNLLAYSSFNLMMGVMKIWSLIAVVESATAILGMLQIGPAEFYTSPVDSQVLMSAGLTRALGTFINPNAAATYISISVFVVLATTWSTGLRTIILMWLFAGIYATGSMGAIISTAVGVSILWFVNWITYKPSAETVWSRLFVLVGATALISLILAVTAPMWLEMALSAEQMETLSLTLGRFSRSMGTRIMLTYDSWTVYQRYPLGIGVDTSVLYTGSLHNDYLAYFIERGPLGLLGWLWLIVATMTAALRATFHRGKTRFRWPLLCLGAGFLACMVNSIFHEVSHFRQLWMLMAFLFALSYLYAINMHTSIDQNASMRAS